MNETKTVNVNIETGVHFGVTCPNSWTEEEMINNSDWFDDFSPVYPEDITEDEAEFFEAETWLCDKPNLKAEYNSNTNIIMVFFSKTIRKCAYCSPCYPNAGDLDTLDENGVKTYSLF